MHCNAANLLFPDCGKVEMYVDDAITLDHDMLFYIFELSEDRPNLVGGVLSPWNCYQVQRGSSFFYQNIYCLVGGVLVCNCFQFLEGSCS